MDKHSAFDVTDGKGSTKYNVNPQKKASEESFNNFIKQSEF